MTEQISVKMALFGGGARRSDKSTKDKQTKDKQTKNITKKETKTQQRKKFQTINFVINCLNPCIYQKKVLSLQSQ